MTTKKDKNIPTINVSITGNVDGNITIGDENTAAIERGSTLAPYGGTAGTRPDPRLLPGKTVAKINNPTGTVTFLFTDIEGSTQLWEQHPEAMQVALARHDAILRQAIETNNGCVFKTVGDAFCAAFTSASQALSAALDAQRAIHAESWGKTAIKVRMGLHSGAAEMRDNDYFGPTLNRVARLMSAGHGGQTLLSAITRELVYTNLPPDMELRDMGERGLKDLVRPEHIYQLLAADLPSEFPPLKTLDTFHTNLPAQLTSFIGREKEIAEVKKLIAANRLTTLTGSGGTGKTRLSLQVAADLLDSFPDGVWFVELAPLVDPALVPQTVMTTIGLREEGNRPVLTILTDYLRPKTALLIFDNCEHLVEASAQLAEALLQACPSLRLLVSSREALGIPGETSYRVPSLSIPDTHLVQSVETVVQSEAARLFIERAQAISSGFAVTDANAAAVAQICARLDGIPLAIELAAARVKMLKAEQIAERLDDRFRLLTGGSRTALPRQQTLRAMIDWSYGLLPESERALLRRLSAFAGGWTLEAAETVCQGQGIDSYDVLDLLTQLVNKSLVVVDADDDTETRYRLLETVRQYAREKLSETGEGMAVRDLHLQYFLGLAEHAEPELVGPNAPEWQKRVEDDLDNIRAALEWSLKGDAQAGLRLANALGFFRGKGFHLYTIRIERANWLTQLLGRPATQPRNAARAKALLVLSAYEQAPANSQAYAEQSLSIYQELNDKAGIASVLLTLGGIIDAQENKVAALSFTFASLALYRKLGDKLGIARALGRLGRLLHTNDYTRAYAYVEESLGLYRELGFAAAVAESLTDLGGIARVSKDYGRARALLLEAQQINFSLGISVLNGGVAEDLGRLAFEEGHYEEARGYLEERIAFDREHGFENNQVTIISLGYVALRQGDQVYARSLFLETLLDARYYQYKTILNVWALEGLASLAVLQNELERAARLFSWTDMMRDTLGNKRTLAEQDEIDRDLAAIHAHLDEAAFAAARAAGRAMSMDQAVACALEAGSD